MLIPVGLFLKSSLAENVDTEKKCGWYGSVVSDL